MKHALITGGAGFIGSHLAEALLARDYHVTVLDDESTGSPENLASGRRPFPVQLRPRLGRRQVARPPPGGRRRRSLSPGRRRRLGVDRQRADPHDRNQSLSHRVDAGRDAPPPQGRPRRQIVSGQLERSLRQEPQGDLERRGRSGLRTDQPAALVVRGRQGDRRVSGPGLLPPTSPADRHRPAVQRRRAQAVGPLRHGACRGSSRRR